jgi:hypothetical protein
MLENILHPQNGLLQVTKSTLNTNHTHKKNHAPNIVNGNSLKMGRTNINIKILQSHTLTIDKYKNYLILQTFARCCHKLEKLKVHMGFIIKYLSCSTSVKVLKNDHHISKCKLIIFVGKQTLNAMNPIVMDP